MKLSHAAALAAMPGDTLRCPTVAGLELQIKPRGKMWYLRYRFAGERRAPKLGEFPALRIDDARGAAREILRAVARGEDPSVAKAAFRTAPRMTDLWAYYERQVLPAKKPRTQEEYVRNWRVHIEPALGSRRVAEVALGDVNAMLRPLGAGGSVRANRVAALLSAMFKLASRSDVKWCVDNPVRGSFRVKESKRKRHITRGEFPEVWAALQAHAAAYPVHVASALVVLLAGSRITEILSARRNQFDAARGCIVLAEHKTDRTGDDRVIWLPPQAVALIARLPQGSPWLFPHEYSASGHLDRYALGYVWDKVRRAAGAPDLRLQDLRRTFASVAKSRGASIAQVGELFGHASSETTDRYAFLFEDAASAIVADTGDAITGLLEGPHGAVRNDVWSG
jgi:integrase